MSILPIRIMGDPVLHAPAAEVTAITDEIRVLVDDMYETMDAAPGVGLAAPQVGVALRIYTYNYVDDSGAPWRGEVINPVLWQAPLVPGSPDEEEESEGCLSVPGLSYALRRSDRVIVTGTNLDGKPVKIEVSGWRARIMQHEFDHLNGVLYIDRISDNDWRSVQKCAKKQGWGVPGKSWMPGSGEYDEA